MATRRTIVFYCCTAIILAVMATVQLASVRGESQTVDEGAHLGAGYSYWKTGDFRMNPEHPPLVKLIASVPLLFLNIHFPNDGSWEATEEWGFARQIIYHSPTPADTILFAAHCAVIIFPLLLGLLIALWSRHLWGNAGGIFSLLLYTADPNFLAHGRYVTTDVPVTCLIALSIFGLVRYLEQPTRKRFWFVAVVFSLAQLAKFSAFLLWPFFILIWFVRWWQADPMHRGMFNLRKLGKFLGMLWLVSAAIIFIMYRFEVKTPFSYAGLKTYYDNPYVWNDSYKNAQSAPARVILSISDPRTPSGKFIESAFTHVPIPAFSYILGLFDVSNHTISGHGAYLMGMRSDEGWWYYFPVALLVKTPLATFLILLVTGLYFMRLGVHRYFQQHGTRHTLREKIDDWRTSTDFEYIVLIGVPVLYLLLSMTSKINLGVRHVLPFFPFLFILAGILTTVRFHKLQWVWQTVLGGMLVVLLTTSALTYPHYLSYFSELVGGSQHGTRYLIDSNLDWGQELKRLGVYEREHNIPFVYITYFGQAPMETYLNDFRYLPRTDEPEKIAALDGWVAISATELFGPAENYAWLRAQRPTDTIGGAIYLYDFRKASDTTATR